MKKPAVWAAGVVLGLVAVTAAAVEVAGVKVDGQAGAANDMPALVLNGAGIRTKFFVKVYVGALYLPAKKDKAVDILAEAGPRRMVMHIVKEELTADHLVSALNEGLAANNSAAELAALKPRIDEFNGIMNAIKVAKKGDVIALDFLPGTGTRVVVNGKTQGTVAGNEFNTALMKVWLGERPVDSDLKKALLGG